MTLLCTTSQKTSFRIVSCVVQQTALMNSIPLYGIHVRRHLDSAGGESLIIDHTMKSLKFG
jgi:hypothetical protein